jgi:hypothetical protein
MKRLQILICPLPEILSAPLDRLKRRARDLPLSFHEEVSKLVFDLNRDGRQVAYRGR